MTQKSETEQRMSEIEGRVKAATGGPWLLCGCGSCAHVRASGTVVAAGIGARDEGYTMGEGVDDEQRRINADFIAHSREDTDWLLAHSRALASRIEEMERAGERLQLAEAILSDFRNAACLSALLGDEIEGGCTCFGCASRAYFAACDAARAQREQEGR